ncbi:disease resistance protein RML1A-like isoform X3 [Arachis hypogaea]|nr:disease resistance protein RML1A-like isoform X2 [Arachis hypogaea]
MIHMDFPKFEKVIRWDGEAFKKMRNLKTLFIRHTYFSQGPKYLPNCLRVLNWEEYPSPCLPLDFHPEGLVIFQLSGKSIQSVRFLEKQKYMSLTVINLDDSNVEEIPDISGVPNLVNLSLNMCLNLIKIDESIVFLDRLSVLSAQGCRRLKRFPSIKLTNLVHLCLSGCSSLEHFPKNVGKIKGYTNNFEKVTSARSEVDVEEEQGSPMAPLEAKHSACKLPDLLHESFTTYLTWFRNVEDLDLSEQNFTVLDESLKELCSLRSLSLNGCRELREIKGIPPNIKYFSARNCISLTYARKYMLLNKELHEDGAKDFVLPSSSIPKWVEHSSNNDSISFWFHNKLPEISLCVLVGPAVDLSRTHICPEFIINSSRGQAEHLESVETSNQLVDHIFITDPKLMKSKVNEVILKNEWNHVVCTIKSCGQRGPAIKKLGIYFHKDRSSVANIQFIDPLLHKEELIMGNFQINMQQQKYMASHERRLSLDLPLGMSFSLNDHVSREPNSSVQGPCVDDLCTLRLGLDYIDLPCHASSERDYGSDSTLLSLASNDTANDGG